MIRFGISFEDKVVFFRTFPCSNSYYQMTFVGSDILKMLGYKKNFLPPTMYFSVAEAKRSYDDVAAVSSSKIKVIKNDLNLLDNDDILIKNSAYFILLGNAPDQIMAKRLLKCIQELFKRGEAVSQLTPLSDEPCARSFKSYGTPRKKDDIKDVFASI